MTIGNRYKIIKQVSSLTKKDEVWLRAGEVVRLISVSGNACSVQNKSFGIYPTNVNNLAEIVP